jgi:hypothetical protein
VKKYRENLRKDPARRLTEAKKYMENEVFL